MEHVLRQIAARSTRLARHPLFSGWLANDAVDPRAKLAFVPMAIDFVMGFRDFNKYYVYYPSPQGHLEAALNSHAGEDETHSALFLEDWGALDTDQDLAWAPRDLYWWMTSDETRESRRLDFELASMTYQNPDARLRFAIIESMEAAGRVFFAHTCPVAGALSERTGRAYRYFGKYHLQRETGHLQEGDEGPFQDARLDDRERATALALVDRVFGIFELHFTQWEAFARARSAGAWSYSPVARGRASAAALRSDPPPDVSACLSLTYPPGPAGAMEELVEARSEAYESLWRSPAYAWVREAWPGDFRTMVRYFFLQWIVDNWACADYFAFDTIYPSSTTPLERGINRLSLLYASEMSRRYVEWETLQLDEFTGWTVGEALRHYWLDDYVEKHREVFADLRKLTLSRPKPLHRYWIMKCFVRFGDTLMRSLGIAMSRAGELDEAFVTFAGSPERLHPDLPVDVEADAAVAGIEREPVQPEDVAIIRSIIEELKRQEAVRTAMTWKVIQERRYDGLHRRWMAKSSRTMRAAHHPDARGDAAARSSGNR